MTASAHPLLKMYWELTKPRLTSLVILTTALGYGLAPKPHSSFLGWMPVVFGSWFLACGAAVLNQYMERDLDRLMHRTEGRPLPSGRLEPEKAFRFGIVLSVLGTLVLAFGVNLLTSGLGLLTLATYLLLYTPLKTRSSLCTLVGAVPGAIPPMMGWTAATGQLSAGAWILFGILFLWQLPHFLAIAWMYRDDYARAGCRMLPVIDPQGGITARMIILYSSVLIPMSLVPFILGLTGKSYFVGALVMSTAFLMYGTFTAMKRTAHQARRLLLASVIYLPALLTWMACSKPAFSR